MDFLGVVVGALANDFQMSDHQMVERQQQMLSRDLPGMGDNMTTDPDAFCNGMGRVMMMGFQGAFNGNSCVLFLFQGWNLDTPTKYTFAIIGTLFMGFVSQALVFARKRYARRFQGYPLFPHRMVQVHTLCSCCTVRHDLFMFVVDSPKRPSLSSSVEQARSFRCRWSGAFLNAFKLKCAGSPHERTPLFSPTLLSPS
jgi:Ctr copper transporter family